MKFYLTDICKNYHRSYYNFLSYNGKNENEG